MTRFSNKPTISEAELQPTDPIWVLDESDTSPESPNGKIKQLDIGDVKTFTSLISEIFDISLVGINTNRPFNQYISEAINAQGPFNCGRGNEFIFQTFGLISSGTASSVSINRYKIISGQTLVGQGTLNFVAPEDVIALTPQEMRIEDDSDFYINLGDIGTTPVVDAFNVGMPGVDPRDPWIIEGLKFIISIESGQPKTYRFTGPDNSYGGDDQAANYTPALASYFQDLAAEASEPGSIALSQIKDIDLSTTPTVGQSLQRDTDGKYRFLNQSGGGSTLDLGQYPTESALETAHPSPVAGSKARINPTDGDPYAAYWDDNSTPAAWKYGNSSPAGVANRTGNSITFDQSAEYNASSPATSGDIILDPTGAIAGVVATYYTTATTEPNVTGATQMASFGSYIPDRLNIISFQWSNSGEFVKVILNQPIVFFNLNYTSLGMTEVPDGIYQNTSGLAYQDAYMISEDPLDGDCEYTCDIGDNSTRGTMFGVSLIGTNRSYNNATPWKFMALVSQGTNAIKTYVDGTEVTPDVSTSASYTAGDVLILRKESDNWKLFYNSTEIHDFGALTGPVFFHGSAYTDLYFRNPRVEIL